MLHYRTYSKIRDLEDALGMPLKKYLSQKYTKEEKSDNSIAREINSRYKFPITSSTIRNYRLYYKIKSRKLYGS